MTLSDQEWMEILTTAPPGSLLRSIAEDVLESRYLDQVRREIVLEKVQAMLERGEDTKT